MRVLTNTRSLVWAPSKPDALSAEARPFGAQEFCRPVPGLPCGRRPPTAYAVGYYLASLRDSIWKFADRVRPGYFSFEKSVGVMNTDSTFSTILPPASDSFCTLIHSGSLRKAAQEAVAASRLVCFSR